MSEKIALVCGRGNLPGLLIHKIKERKEPLLILAINKLTSPEIVSEEKEVHWFDLGQLGEVLAILKNKQVKKLLTGGEIDKKLLFQRSLLDKEAKHFLDSLEDKRDLSILKGLEQIFAQEGIEFIDPYPYLAGLLTEKGFFSQRKPTPSESKDIELGWKVAKRLSSEDIGHTVVLKQGRILAVEAAEGTNRTIKRGGKLGGKGTIVVKVARERQNLKFDPPVIGSETVEVCQEARASALAFEAKKTIVVDKEKMVQMSNSSGMSLVGL